MTKGIQDKVKDIVEVRPYKSIRDFTADPAETLRNYHFTDSTAELMAKWLNGAANTAAGESNSFALAGYRGVGKSHFLAAFGSLASKPELRDQISDSHVEFSARRLQRRHYPVVYLRRGSGGTLLDEFKTAVVETMGLPAFAEDASFEDVFTAASVSAGEASLILLIDTALERGNRVSRDDGSDLSRMSEIAKDLNVFIGVALDDDIAGADGSNAAIVRAYTIDYLDQAHLYKVVNSEIFPKYGQMQPALNEIYAYFRSVLSSFRWSEQKFSSLYPLHPAILEVAPYVRLYVHDFALLGFASEAGEKILGRPANSLIALDEVFDSAENGLRKVNDLSEAFGYYDTISSNVVSRIPVMQRLHAKLILKALLLLSLDGQGATAADLCACELIFDETDHGKAEKTVEELLKTFQEALPEAFNVVSTPGQSPRYSFKVSSREDLNNALSEAVFGVGEDVVENVLRKVFEEKFSDACASGDELLASEREINSQIVWRGSVRKGRIHWLQADGRSPQLDSGTDTDDPLDWQVFIDSSEVEVRQETVKGHIADIIWKVDALRPDEIDKIKSYFALNEYHELREQFNEQITAAIHSHYISVEKIFNRRFLEDGKLVIDGFDYNFTEEARSADSLPGLFAPMLEPLFETHFPEHPYFTRQLDVDDVASIITDLYNDSRRELADVQSRAQTFAFPLGLVRLEGTSFLPETKERIVSLPVAKLILDTLAGSSDTIPLSELSDLLRNTPYGLLADSQKMLLTALVAERLVEFVTKSGNRISRRSLDLSIIWEDIVGVARPAELEASSANRLRWARLFFKDTEIGSIDRVEDQERLLTAMSAWHERWTDQRVLEQFNLLPDDVLNVKIWRIASRTAKTFGSISRNILRSIEGNTSAGECLDRIAEAFSDSEVELSIAEAELQILNSFVSGAALRNEVISYVTVCEVTDDPEIENLRIKLNELCRVSSRNPSEQLNRELGYSWERFRRQYALYFKSKHDPVMNSPARKADILEFLRSDIWMEFSSLSEIAPLNDKFRKSAYEYRRVLSGLDCKIDPLSLLEIRPFCHCDFSLSRGKDLDLLPDALRDTALAGTKSFKSYIQKNGEAFAQTIESISDSEVDDSILSACRDLVLFVTEKKHLQHFTDLQLKIINEAGRSLRSDADLRHHSETKQGNTSATLDSDITSDNEEETFEETEDSILLKI